MNGLYSVEQIFKERILQIPDYQRGYAWEGVNWRDLIEDIETLPPKRAHYTGTLVLDARDEKHRDEEGLNYGVFDVVDGQQRLTTLVILLDCIRRELSAFPSSQKLAQGIHRSYACMKGRDGQPIFKLRLNADCREYFEQVVLAANPSAKGPTIQSHRRLSEAAKYFTAYLQSRQKGMKDYETWLIGLFDKVTERLKLNLYVVADDTEVGVVFEVMNNRGKALSELEKVKNYLLYLGSKLDLQGHGLGTAVNAAWKDILENLMAFGLGNTQSEDALLRYHWLMSFDPDPKRWTRTRSVKEKFNLRDYPDHRKLLADLLDYVRSLRDASIAYCEVVDPTNSAAFQAWKNTPRDRERVVEIGVKLARLDPPASLIPLLMAVRLRAPLTPQSYLDVAQLSERLIFRVFWGLADRKRRADAGEVSMLRMAFDLYTGKATVPPILGRLRDLTRQYSSDHEFKAGFTVMSDEDDWYSWPGLKYLLYEYEESLAAGKPVQMPWEVVSARPLKDSIEHILPQTATDPYWKARFDAAALKKYTHDLGNLSLTFDNSAYGNKPFPAKKGTPGQGKCYADSSLFMERALSQYGDWDPAAVQDRRKKIVDWALLRWSL